MIFFRIVMIVGGLYAVILAFFFLFQNSFMFFPTSEKFGRCPEMERFSVKAVSSGRLRFYLREVDKPLGWIVIFHGNAGSACDRMYYVDLFQDIPANIVILEYPGFGKDGRKPGEKIILSEASNLIKHIQNVQSEKLPIYLLGESLGTGVATWLAAEEEEVQGLILISPYTSFVDLAAAHYFWLPVNLLLKNRFLADKWAKNVNSKVLAFHGMKDTIIPIKFARQQMTNFSCPKKLIEFDNTAHNDITITGKTVIHNEVEKFILSF